MRCAATRTEREGTKRRYRRLVTLFCGLVSTIRSLATRMRSTKGGWRLRGWVAFVAYDGNGVVAQIDEQLLRLLFGRNEPASLDGTRRRCVSLDGAPRGRHAIRSAFELRQRRPGLLRRRRIHGMIPQYPGDTQ